MISRWKRAQVSFQRLEAFYELEPEKINEKNTLTSISLKGKIEIKDLNFCYPETNVQVLKNINLTIKKGETIGIIGTIGSGKTTLINLLTRLYSVSNGKILIDETDINDIPIEVLRTNICYISQDNFLFSASIQDNVSLFKEDYEVGEITQSIKKAMVYEDISQMENGINTNIGENGGDLSGGQKQRIAIARAFLKNSSIFVFDDTFSALDNRTSKELLENMKELTKEKTCIIISNKVSDVKYSDKIIVLDHGELVEEGTHEELLAKKGLYNEFFKRQSREAKCNLLS